MRGIGVFLVVVSAMGANVSGIGGSNLLGLLLGFGLIIVGGLLAK